jgi:hypothetical protein
VPTPPRDARASIAFPVLAPFLAPVLGVLLCFVLGGCADGGGAGPGADASPDAPASPGVERDAALVVEGDGASTQLCLRHVKTRSDLAVFQDFLVASTPLSITGVRAVGVGAVDAPGGLAVAVVGRRPVGTGIVTWPVRASTVRKSVGTHVDWRGRTNLVGAHLDVQRAVLTFVHLRGGPGARLGGLEYSYRTDAGKTGTARSAAAIRFDRGGCR